MLIYQRVSYIYIYDDVFFYNRNLHDLCIYDLGPNIWYPTWLNMRLAEMKVSMIYTAFNGIYRAFNGIYSAFNGDL